MREEFKRNIDALTVEMERLQAEIKTEEEVLQSMQDGQRADFAHAPEHIPHTYPPYSFARDRLDYEIRWARMQVAW